ncbi:hypothetical protein [Streptomyces sp. NPDC054874]
MMLRACGGGRMDVGAERMNPRRTIELDAGHASLASQPGPVADLIEEATGSAGS